MSPVPSVGAEVAACAGKAAASTLGTGDMSHWFKNASDQVPEFEEKSSYTVDSFLTKVRIAGRTWLRKESTLFEDFPSNSENWSLAFLNRWLMSPVPSVGAKVTRLRL